MELQLLALMVEDEDGVEEESEHERPPRHEISQNIVQMARGQAAGSSAIAKGRSVVRGRNKEKGSATSSWVVTRSCFFRILVVKVINFA